MILLKQTGVSSVNFCFAKGGSMPKRPLESLGVIVREKRAHRKLRETAKEIGIGPATLMRIESGRIPDVETFGKICRWLKKDPAEFLGFDVGLRKASSTEQSISTIAAHFKADQTPKPETVKALVQMVLIAMSTQPGLSEPEI
jgi:transcriptional regulator with XRE-family HTH domain